MAHAGIPPLSPEMEEFITELRRIQDELKEMSPKPENAPRAYSLYQRLCRLTVHRLRETPEAMATGRPIITGLSRSVAGIDDSVAEGAHGATLYYISQGYSIITSDPTNFGNMIITLGNISSARAHLRQLVLRLREKPYGARLEEDDPYASDDNGEVYA